ncbi:HET-domain-containing protein [Hypoxylon sp. EC38]|nr:HET-domain-containing protein [Hypoxylon sp. EC38]
MWLLNTKSRSLEEFNEDRARKTPYAILSHVWGTEEVLFHELREPQASTQKKAGWVKMTQFCDAAEKCGFLFAWIDTCCIDKRNSAELSEAINSMYGYYRDAAECFIYLQDVSKATNGGNNLPLAAEATSRHQLLRAVRASRWLTRGWTLQELLAPARRRFFDGDWSDIEVGTDLLDALAESTGISRTVLENRDLLSDICIAERMKWASQRQTTRGEDIAYSLMGLFKVHMPVMYGEGAENAFKRLQREIMQLSFDMTIFAWRGDYENSGLLAHSPADFADNPALGLWMPWMLVPFSTTNVGLSIQLNVMNEEQIADQKHRELGEGDNNFKKQAGGTSLLGALQCDVQMPTGEWQVLIIYLEPVGAVSFFVNGRECKAYRRIRCSEWMTLPHEQVRGWSVENVLVLEDEQYNLARQALRQHISRMEKDAVKKEKKAKVGIDMII